LFLIANNYLNFFTAPITNEQKMLYLCNTFCPAINSAAQGLETGPGIPAAQAQAQA
jgi:hypothetical protein